MFTTKGYDHKAPIHTHVQVWDEWLLKSTAFEDAIAAHSRRYDRWFATRPACASRSD